MQVDVKETVKETEMPKKYKERLDELKIGGFIPIDNDEERDKFSATVYRDFHKPKEITKLFTIRTDRETGQKAVWRLK